MSIRIAPLDDATKKRLLSAVAHRGQASGLEAAAKLVKMMADNSTRVVGTNTVKDLAAALLDKAQAIRAEADANIAAMEAETKSRATDR